MVKKCIGCAIQAKFKIKDTSEYYCEECAAEHFADLNLLIKVEEKALQLKHIVDLNDDLPRN